MFDDRPTIYASSIARQVAIIPPVSCFLYRLSHVPWPLVPRSLRIFNIHNFNSLHKSSYHPAMLYSSTLRKNMLLWVLNPAAPQMSMAPHYVQPAPVPAMTYTHYPQNHYSQRGYSQYGCCDSCCTCWYACCPWVNRHCPPPLLCAIFLLISFLLSFSDATVVKVDAVNVAIAVNSLRREHSNPPKWLWDAPSRSLFNHSSITAKHEYTRPRGEEME